MLLSIVMNLQWMSSLPEWLLASQLKLSFRKQMSNWMGLVNWISFLHVHCNISAHNFTTSTVSKISSLLWNLNFQCYVNPEPCPHLVYLNSYLQIQHLWDLSILYASCSVSLHGIYMAFNTTDTTSVRSVLKLSSHCCQVTLFLILADKKFSVYFSFPWTTTFSILELITHNNFMQLTNLKAPHFVTFSSYLHLADHSFLFVFNSVFIQIFCRFFIKSVPRKL